jgi:hypothetical protein
MKNLLLVGHMNEAKTIPHDGMVVRSVNSPGGLRGLSINAVYATELAKASPRYEKALSELAICVMARDRWAGTERVL